MIRNSFDPKIKSRHEVKPLPHGAAPSCDFGGKGDPCGGPFETGDRPFETSDANDMQRRVRNFLAASNMPSLRHVRVEVEGDTVALSGAVCSYYEKQMAVQLAARVAGVHHVHDAVIVRSYVPLPKSRHFHGRSRDEAPALREA